MNMKKVREKKFWDIFYNTELNILEFHWKNTGQDMEDEEFKSYLLEVIELLKTYPVKGLLIEGSKYHITIPPKMQEWHNKNIIPAYLKAGVEVMTFILDPKELIIVLSLEQSFDEEQIAAHTMEIHFLDSLEAGRELIKNKV